MYYILDNSRPIPHQYCLSYTPTLSVVISFLLSHTVVILVSSSPILVNHVFISTQSLLKQVNVPMPYFDVFKVLIFVFCYVLLKFVYAQYWNTIPSFDRLHRKKTLRPSKKYNVGLRRDSLEIAHTRNGFGS